MLIKDYMAKIGKYRAHIMGFCILDVLIGHSDMIFRLGPLSYLTKLLWVIDIFFFMTGLGAYHSLSKNPSLLPFYKRRFMRVYPCYLPVILIYVIPIFVYAIRFSPELLLRNIQEFLGNLFLMGWFAGLDNQFNWYIQALMVFYLVAPPMVLLVKHFEGSGKKLAGLLLFFCVTQVCFFGSGFLVAYARTIAFVMGIIAADLAVRNKNFKLNVPLMLILWVIGNGLAYYLHSMPTELGMKYGFSWYPGLIIIPGMMLILSWVFEFCSKHKALAWISSAFSVLGQYSLEIYIVNVLGYDLLARCGISLMINSLPNYLIRNAVWFVIAIALGVISIIYGKFIHKLLARKKTA